MKRVKIMLMSLLLLAVVGGALAFKAKFNIKYCTTNAVLNPQQVLTCPALVGRFCVDADQYSIAAQDPVQPSIENVCYTTTNGNDNCGQHQDCRTKTTLTEDN